MTKAIFWDSDGTLLYANESFKISLIRALENEGYTPDEADVKSLMKRICTWHTPEKDHSRQNGEAWWQELLAGIKNFCLQQGIAPEHISAICHAFRQNVIAYEYEPYADVKAVLHAFRERGFANYIISNNFPELDQVFRRLGLDQEIAGYILSGSVGYEKPRREIFDCARQLAGNPDICYMIGDNPVADGQGGLNAGMKPVLVHNHQEGMICCENLSDLLTVIPS